MQNNLMSMTNFYLQNFHQRKKSKVELRIEMPLYIFLVQCKYSNFLKHLLNKTIQPFSASWKSHISSIECIKLCICQTLMTFVASHVSRAKVIFPEMTFIRIHPYNVLDRDLFSVCIVNQTRNVMQINFLQEMQSF